MNKSDLKVGLMLLGFMFLVHYEIVVNALGPLDSISIITFISRTCCRCYESSLLFLSPFPRQRPSAHWEMLAKSRPRVPILVSGQILADGLHHGDRTPKGYVQGRALG